MAVFIFSPLASLVLAPLWWFVLGRAGPLTYLILWFVLVFLIGTLMPTVVWLGGMGAVLWAMVHRWRSHTKQGLPVRDLFIRPRQNSTAP